MSNNLSQDGRERDSSDAPALLGGGNTIVYVQYGSSGFQWGTSTSSLVPLSTTIVVASSSTVTFEFIRSGSTALWYKLPPSSPSGTVLPTSNGPTVAVPSGSNAGFAVATSSGGPYSTGYVKVSGDGFRFLSADAAGDDDDQ